MPSQQPQQQQIINLEALAYSLSSRRMGKTTDKNIYPQAALLEDKTNKKVVNKFLNLMKENDGWAKKMPKKQLQQLKQKL